MQTVIKILTSKYFNIEKFTTETYINGSKDHTKDIISGILDNNITAKKIQIIHVGIPISTFYLQEIIYTLIRKDDNLNLFRFYNKGKFSNKENELGDEEIQYIAKALAHPNCCIKSITFPKDTVSNSAQQLIKSKVAEIDREIKITYQEIKTT